MRRFIIATTLAAGLGACDAEELEHTLELQPESNDADDPAGPPNLANHDEPVAACELFEPFECDPLDLSTCERGEGCYPQGDGFTCIVAGSGQAGTPCEAQDQCAPAHFCAAEWIVPGCTTDGCCSRFCRGTELGCLPGQECVPWFDAPPDECWENVGACADLS